jgi:dCTP deaminase
MGDGNSGLGGILSDSAIRKAVEYGDIEIDPFDPERLNPCSYDLALGNEIVSYQSGAGAPVPYLDARVRPGTYSFKFDDGMVLHPNVGYLMHTVERVATKKYVPVLDGKSSLGRLFMKIHETAGYGDPGFDGQYTLEVTVMYPFLVRDDEATAGSSVQRVGWARAPYGRRPGDGRHNNHGRAPAAHRHNGEVQMAPRTGIIAKRDERAKVRSSVLSRTEKFDITKDWEARGPARALFEDTSARAIEHLHGFEEGRDARVFARMNSEGEGEIHIVGADAEARAAIKAVIENARKVHVVEREIAKPELDAAKRVQSAWSAGNLLPPRRPASSEGAPPRNAAMALPTHEDDVDDDADSSSVRPGRGARRRTGGEP